MTSSTRRVVRLTVLTPTGDLDLAVADDAVAAEVVRVVLTSGATDGSTGCDGWRLVHPVAGVVPPAACLEDFLGGLQEGEILHLTPATGEYEHPVDDVTEVVRTRPAAPTGVAVLAGAAIAATLVPVVAAVALARAGADPTVAWMLGVLLGTVTPFTVRGHGRATDVVCVVAAMGSTGSAVAWAAGTMQPGRSVVVGLSALVMAMLVGGSVSQGRWWRPGLVASATASAVSGAHVIASVMAWDAARAQACVAVVVAGILAAALPVALTTSGLGGLDDRVARGESVPATTVGAAVARAGDDLMGMYVVLASAAAWLGVSASDGIGVGIALAVGVLLTGRAAACADARHAVTLTVGSAAGAVAALVGAVAVDDPRVVPLLVLACVALTWAVRQLGVHGLDPLTAGRLRSVLGLADRGAAVALPLLVAGAFDLYGRLWAVVS